LPHHFEEPLNVGEYALGYLDEVRGAEAGMVVSG
jgi:hypothetical protein